MLVVSAADVGTQMIKAGLDEGLVPYTEVDLTDPGRPLLSDDFLADQPTPGVRRAKFQAVVLPNDAPGGLAEEERDALARFQREFKIRQLDAYVYPSAAVGLGDPSLGGYAGPLDGMVADTTAAAAAGDFSHLTGRLVFDDEDAATLETYGYLAPPLPPDPQGLWSFTTLVDMPIPNSTTRGVLLGVYRRDDGREELVLTGTVNPHQLVQQALFPGILRWLTHGVHLGTERNYLSVHIDDVFLDDARWDAVRNCTVGDDCPAEVTAPGILMTPADVDYLVDWQRRQGLKLDIVYNGDGYDTTMAEQGSFPLGQRLLASKDELRWVSHTYTHLYLGCVQDFTRVPWACATDADGQVLWTPYATVERELRENLAFATRQGLSIDPRELVTGEHSGLRRAPEEPSDNPELVRALSALGVAFVGSDGSREFDQRMVGGGARTVPRYPMNIFYNVGRKSEQVDEYNWIYTSRAEGGSGICEVDPRSTCIQPLDTATGFDTYILTQEARSALLHALSNSPRPHYAHQSNLAEDRILYPVLDQLLADYRRVFKVPLVNPTLTQAGSELQSRADWAALRTRVRAYVQGGALIVLAAGSGKVPLTVPVGTRSGTLSSDGGGLTGWQAVSAPGRLLTLPSSVPYGR